MSFEINDFIYVEDNFLDKEKCDFLIEKYSEMLSNHEAFWSQTYSGYAQFQDVLLRHDEQLFVEVAAPNDTQQLTEMVFSAMGNYQREFPSVSSGSPLWSHTIKFQRTPVGGGFGRWHSENGAGLAAHRIIAWMIYLNDVEDGGETEFVYQKRRLKPKAGTIVLWPAGFTHTHRGNPPYSNEKYVLTGWISVPPFLPENLQVWDPKGEE